MDKVERGALVHVQPAGAAVHFIRYDILAVGFFPVRVRYAYVPGVYCAVYSHFWPGVLWLGMSANHFYGNGLPQNRILD